MKKLVTVLMLAATTSLTALAVASPAAAAPRHQQEQSSQPRVVGEGYYDGDREMRIDSQDRASSPYAGGGM